jgi:hypothetical protein
MLEFRTSFSHYDAPVFLPIIASVALQINASIRIRTEHLNTCELVRLLFTDDKEVALFIRTLKNCGVELSCWSTIELRLPPGEVY